ncbi:alpha/beta fold hydrolase [Tropicimonas sp. IMCC34043]|uniref:alpha/beta fold hydrolase n=1 Tax=Tropicimonas sp. IMCC34043 TaxID=2248760 RepID=UPI0018E58853|nr:alpha/beta hydrolase [Tropicimonas sp. IMCC34043]
MPDARIGRRRVHYTLDGPEDAPLLAFVNGLTQYSNLWAAYSTHFVDRGLRVLRFDMLGQGESDKPALGGRFEDHWQTLDAILDHIGVEKAFVAGISFGGTVAVQFACERPDRCLGLVAMSCFAELPPQLFMMGSGLYEALVQVGLPALQRWLMPMNMSDDWLTANAEALPEMMRRGYAINDLYALQNLMESVSQFRPITGQLGQIPCPTLILNGEYDFFTPRKCHEVLRKGIANSRLVIVQHAYHAYTLEHPAVTMRLIGTFIDRVLDGTWTGDQTVWVAADDPEAAEPWFPCPGDHLRAVPLPAPPAPPAIPAPDPASTAAPATAEPATRPTPKTPAPRRRAAPKPAAASAAGKTPKRTAARPKGPTDVS